MLGALLATTRASSITDGLAAQGIDPAAWAPAARARCPTSSTLPAPVAQVVEHAYGTGIAEIFLVAAPLGLVAFVALLFMRERPLGSKSGIELAAAEPHAA